MIAPPLPALGLALLILVAGPILAMILFVRTERQLDRETLREVYS